MRKSQFGTLIVGICMATMWAASFVGVRAQLPRIGTTADEGSFDQVIAANIADMVTRGREIFRYDTFGSEAFWGDTLKLHQAIEGARFGGVGTGVSPATALAVGLKVDAQKVPQS